MTKKGAIIVCHDPPPIPIRQFDWSAVRYDYEPPMPIGYGATMADAIYDLLEQESDE
jgi:hypothetical protein